MLEHLVHSHLGGYYISNGDPEFIEQYCETCGDSDYILTSWNSEEENARLNALLKCFINNNLSTKEDLDKKVEEYDECFEDKKEIIPAIIYDIKYDNEETKNIVTSLYEGHDISEEEYNKVIRISNFNETRQLNMIKKYADTYFSKDKDKKVKVLKNRNVDNR